ncbi:MAG: efflux RND transporter periplasmic adaptor subunit [Verrucomicrobia bacterium]|nr:efflux RND transporter periplasmic adaptor subunit [Verrucomicrobiota bacterium]
MNISLTLQTPALNRPSVASKTGATSLSPARRKSRAMWYILGGLLLAAGLGGAAYWKSQTTTKATVVTIEKAVIKTLTQVVTATGKVQPEVEVKISTEAAGEIIEMPLKEGARVKKGDLLVRIKPDNYQAQVDQQEANLTAARAASLQAKAQLLKAQDDFRRVEDLHAKKLVSDSDHLASKTALEVAQANFENSLAQIRRTEGSLNQARDQLSKTVIYSPMEGTISAQNSEIGERVVGTGSFAGTEIMRVADLANMELRVRVNENDIVNVKLGDRAIISIDAYPGRKFNGTVSEISSSAQGSSASSQLAAMSDDVTNFLVKIRISDRDVQLRPGMSATTDIETKTVENVVAVPIQSVTVRAVGGLTTEELQKKMAKEAEKKSGSAPDAAAEKQEARRNRESLSKVAFIRTGDSVKMQKVEVGIADNTHIEVKSGLKEGDEVVSGSYAAISRTLKDGMKVTLEKPKKETEKK